MEDISPYATFQLTDPMKKFHEEGFSQDIVVPKFYDVMQQQTYSLRRGDTNKKRQRSSNIYEEKWSANRRKSLRSDGEAEQDEEDDEEEGESESETIDESQLGSGFQSIMTASMNDRSSRSLKQQYHRQQKLPHGGPHLLHQMSRSHHHPSSYASTDVLPSGNMTSLLPNQLSKSQHQQRGYLGLAMELDSTSPEASPPRKSKSRRSAAAEGNNKKVR